MAIIFNENEKGCRFFKICDENNNLKPPTAKTECSAGYDVHSPYDFVLKAGEIKVIDTKIKFYTKYKNDFLMILPRSGLGFKYGLVLRNTAAVIDSDYDDTIKLSLVNTGDKDIEIKFNDAIAQILIQQYQTLIPDVRNIEKRNGGFGSTGR